mmetsp:Transcript_139066/g.444129  ORF Transcript_139066/g.444129 Transcript_139066/m.444129 type:complete len:223 (-) Transcript_139066:323-991(-)
MAQALPVIRLHLRQQLHRALLHVGKVRPDQPIGVRPSDLRCMVHQGIEDHFIRVEHQDASVRGLRLHVAERIVPSRPHPLSIEEPIHIAEHEDVPIQPDYLLKLRQSPGLKLLQHHTFHIGIRKPRHSDVLQRPHVHTEHFEVLLHGGLVWKGCEIGQQHQVSIAEALQGPGHGQAAPEAGAAGLPGDLGGHHDEGLLLLLLLIALEVGHKVLRCHSWSPLT